MTPAYAVICGSMVLLGASAVLGFFWAARSGQFRNLQRGSEAIFDESEPIGMPTDVVFKKREKRRKNPDSSINRGDTSVKK